MVVKSIGGGVIGACSLVNNELPPYAVAVGTPARVIGVRFSKEQIMRHEQKMYPAEKRMTSQQLDRLFVTTYSDVRVMTNAELTDDALQRVKAGLERDGLQMPRSSWSEL